MLDGFINLLFDSETREVISTVAGSMAVVGVLLMLVRSIRRMRRRQAAAHDRRLSHLRGH